MQELKLGWKEAGVKMRVDSPAVLLGKRPLDR